MMMIITTTGHCSLVNQSLLMIITSSFEIKNSVVDGHCFVLPSKDLQKTMHMYTMEIVVILRIHVTGGF
jgi:hypothetical protein